jgi:hypothetical protein
MQLLKVTKKSGAGTGFEPWHPNFRNTDELPDIKTVRTKFFVNAACVVVALAVVLFCLYTEYRLRGLNREIDNWQQQIDRDSKASRATIAEYKKFKAQEARTSELLQFLEGEKLTLSDFVVSIGQTLPENVVLTDINLREADVVLRGVVKGPAELASGTASGYEKQLRESRDMGALFNAISLSTLSRDPATGFLNFELVLKFKK